MSGIEFLGPVLMFEDLRINTYINDRVPGRGTLIDKATYKVGKSA